MRVTETWYLTLSAALFAIGFVGLLILLALAGRLVFETIA